MAGRGLVSHTIKLGAWRPDMGVYGGNHWVEACNVLPSHRGYVPGNSLSEFSDAIGGSDDTVHGLYATFDSANASRVFAGTQNAIYRQSATGTWTKLGQISSTLSDFWQFVSFGDDIFILSDAANIQKVDATAATNTLTAVTGSPRAKYGVAIRNFLVAGGILNHPTRLQWSGYLQPESWAASRSTQAGFQDLPTEFGAIQAIVPGSYGTIIQTNAIWRLTYVGPPQVWRLDQAKIGDGTTAPYSVCWYDNNVYYYSHDGFHMFDGQQVVPIGAGKVDTWFRNTVADSTSTLGVVDGEYKRVLWAFDSGAGDSRFDKILVYSWDVDEWSCVDMDLELIGTSLTASRTLEDLDTLYPTPGGIDGDNQTSFDSSAYKKTFNFLVGVTPNRKVASFTGDVLMPVSIKTAYNGVKEKTPLLFNEARVILDWGSYSPTVGTDNHLAALQSAMRFIVNAKDQPDDMSPRSAEAVLSPRGDFQLLLPGRLFQYDLVLNNNYEQLTELTITFRQQGRRYGRV